MSDKNSTSFLRAPLRHAGGIPIFEETDGYIENYNRIAMEHLDSIDAGRANPFMESRQVSETVKKIQSLILNYVPTGSKVLDAGVGLGSLLAPLNQYRRYGLDIALPYLKVAQHKIESVCLARLESAPYHSSYFDAIVTVDVLEHVLELDRAVTELSRMLKPGGLLIVDVPNEERLESYLDSPFEFVHLRSFSLSGLRLYFEKVFGYEYIMHDYSAWLFNSLDASKVRLVSNSSPVISWLKAKQYQVPELDGLRQVLSYPEEQFVDDMIALRDSKPELATPLFGELMRPAELACVFRKRK